MRNVAFVFAVVAALALPAGARIIIVPDSAATIQSGVNTASGGDTVLVAPGTYFESVSISGKSITLAGRFLLSRDTLDIVSTVIDANHAGTVVSCDSLVDTTALICGFTVRNGSSGNGGGIACQGASPRITWNIVEDNVTGSDGAGIYINPAGSPIVEHNIIRNNQSSSWGGGMYIFDGSSPRVRWNVFYDNGVAKNAAAAATGPGQFVAGRPVEPSTCADLLVTNGGAILVTNYTGQPTRPRIHNNTIVDNEASGLGGGIYSNRASPDIRNNIIVSNENYGVYSAETVLVCNYNDVWANANDYGGTASGGTGALSADPLFVDSGGHDFHLASGSPCIDAGDPGLPKDPDSTRCDIGAFSTPQTGLTQDVPTLVRRQLRVFPNPFAGSAATAPATRLVVYDAGGRVAERTTDGRFGSALVAGVYFVRADGFTRTRVVKLAPR